MKCDNILLCAVIGIIIIYGIYYFFFMTKSFEETFTTETANDDLEYLLGGADMATKLVPNMKCSKSCCGQQWKPMLTNLPYDPLICNSNEDYVPTNLTCSDQNTTGCVCAPSWWRNYMNTRARNTE